MALADADCKFLYINAGCNGRISDGGVLGRSDLMDIIRQADIHFPPDELVGNNRNLPFVFIGDDAFALQKHLMKPFPHNSTERLKQIFNLRLSHARQCVERAFGILANRFRVLRTTISLDVETVNKIVLCCCVLHNFLIEKSEWYQKDLSRYQTSSGIQGLQRGQANRRSQEAANIRDSFAEYFINEGNVDWQDAYL